MASRGITIGFIGAGMVGTTLALALSQSGYRVAAVASRRQSSADKLADRVTGCQSLEPQAVVDGVDLLFVTTPDDAIASVVAGLQWHPGQSVVHCSGAASTAVLEPAREAGARVGGFHPLQTFASPEEAVTRLPGTTFALEAEEPLLGMLIELAKALGGRWVRLSAEDKVLYHASAVVACNYLVTLVKLATDLWQRFGVAPDDATIALLPLLEGTLNNLKSVGLPNCLTGPISRGDIGTLQSHVTALAKASPEVLETYCSLGLQTIPIARQKATVDAGQAEEMERLLLAARKVRQTIHGIDQAATTDRTL